MRKKATNKQKAYQVEFQKNNTTRIRFQLNNEYDADIIEFMNTLPNKNGYLKDLVREDMKKRSQ